MVAQVSDWFQYFSEPVRLKVGIHPCCSAPQPARLSYFGGLDPHIIGWHRAFSEPVRRKPPLLAQRPAHFATLPYFQFMLSVTETGDTGAFVINSYVVHNRARVTITEVPYAGQANVTFQEINYSRGFHLRGYS